MLAPLVIQVVQVDEFKVSLVYKMSFSIVRAVKKDEPRLENKTKPNQKMMSISVAVMKFRLAFNSDAPAILEVTL